MYKIATENTVWAMPEIAIGLFPDHGSSYFLNQIDENRFGKLGLYLALTADQMTGKDLVITGLAQGFIDLKKLDKLKIELSSAVSDLDISNILENSEEASKDWLNLQNLSYFSRLPDINKHFSKNSIPEIMDSLKSDQSKFAQSTFSKLDSYPKSSLYVTYEQQTRGKTLSLDEVFKMEWGIGCQMMHEKDFFEGVRAKLVDKDNAPVWVDDSWDESLERYFKCAHNETGESWEISKD
jgi:enoyl-CoA hydratase/carnithine racemase